MDYTVADIVREYIEDAELRRVRALSGLKRACGHIVSFCGEESADGIVTSRLRDFQLHLNKRYAPASVNVHVKMFRTVLRLAEQNGRISRAPLSPRRLPEPPPRQGFVESDDFNSIMRELPDWAADVIAFAFASGWRKSESLGLTWSDVDWDGGIVTLGPERTKAGDFRALPVAGDVEAILQKRWVARVVGLDRVFHRQVWGRARPINRTSLRDAFVPAAIRAGRPGLYIHDMRRSCVRDLVRAGIPEAVAMKFTGHKTRWIFERYNIVSTKEMARAAVDLAKYRKKRVDTGN